MTEPLKPEIKLIIETPRVPSFVTVTMPGNTDPGKLSIADLSDGTLDQVADSWRYQLKARAAEIREHRKHETTPRGGARHE